MRKIPVPFFGVGLAFAGLANLFYAETGGWHTSAAVICFAVSAAVETATAVRVIADREAAMDRREPDERLIDEILNDLGMKDREFNFPSQLSGGQQQRVSIGRALINSPMMVLADEPTGNLDSKNSQEIVELLKRSNKQYNQTLIVITHARPHVSRAE